MRPQLYANKGNAQFADTLSAAGPYLSGEYLGRGVARLDFDGDGRPDLAVVHQDRPVGLLHNETEGAGHAVVVELHGVASNRDAIGAKIVVMAGGKDYMLQVCGGDGFFSSNEKRQFIGVGAAEHVERFCVLLPVTPANRRAVHHILGNPE